LQSLIAEILWFVDSGNMFWVWEPHCLSIIFIAIHAIKYLLLLPLWILAFPYFFIRIYIGLRLLNAPLFKLSCVLNIRLLNCLWLLGIFLFRMIQSLRSEAGRSEDMFALLQEIQESVRLAFLNCFLDFAGKMNNLFQFYIWK
jgi:hypothetical protein